MSVTLSSSVQRCLETGDGSIMGALYESEEDQVTEMPLKLTPWQETVLKIVWEGIDSVSQKVPVSLNYLTRSPIDPSTYGVPIDKLAEHLDEDLTLRRVEYIGKPLNPPLIKKIANLTTQGGSGNCDELVVVGMDYLQPLLEKVNAVIEPFHIVNGKHTISIIRRKTEEVPDVEFVDPEGIVGDFWMRDAYPVSEKETRLHVVETIAIREDGLTYPVFAPLNETHKLVRYYTPPKRVFFP
ncbi:MAG TPA: hypothetical protein VLG44_05840 [Chlamydiales bacterium]|nr:hypothetical protein [Chlamydiales bacterium]